MTIAWRRSATTLTTVIRMTRGKLTKRQRQVMTWVWKGNTVRKRGAYGGSQVDPSDGKWASSLTIDKLVSGGWLRPARGWGEYEGTGR